MEQSNLLKKLYGKKKSHLTSLEKFYSDENINSEFFNPDIKTDLNEAFEDSGSDFSKSLDKIIKIFIKSTKDIYTRELKKEKKQKKFEKCLELMRTPKDYLKGNSKSYEMDNFIYFKTKTTLEI